MLRRHARHGPIGLDFGACGVKLLQFSEVGDRPTLVAAAHCPISPTGEGAGHGDAGVEHAVADALRRGSFRGRRVVASLGCGEFQIKSIRLPRMPAEERLSAIEFEAQDRFGVDAQGAQIRHIVAGEVRHGNELKDEIIVFVASVDAVHAHVGLLERLGLRPVAMDVAPCCVARGFFRFLRRAEDAKAVNVFLDLGWRGTSIVLTRGTEVSFLKTIDVGGLHFSQAVAEAMSISQEEAAELRVRIMSEACGRRTSDERTVPEGVRTTVEDAVRGLVERIGREVQLCLRYFAVTFRGQRPGSLTLVGGEAHEPALSRMIGEQIDIPCTIGNPLTGLSPGGVIGARNRRAFLPAWAVASGLALRGSRWVQRVDPHAASAAYRQAVAGGR